MRWKPLCGENELSAFIASLLVSRGLIEYEEIQEFLKPSIDHIHDPFLLPDMHKAIERIQFAVQNREQICVYGDYDADGICATAILTQYLQSCGALAEPFVPSRHQEGYGMNEDAVRRLVLQGIRLIITVDNGISALNEVAVCHSLGIDVIVTDHHQCPSVLPICEAVVNPQRPDSRYPNNCLCGAGVALKLVQAMGGLKAIDQYLPLAALATVADVVMLRGENRTIVTLGLQKVSEHIGLNALLSVSGSAGQEVTSDMMAFRLAPRLNAAGRMGDASRALSLLLTEDAEQARNIALTLNDENERRQAEEQRMLRDARSMLQNRDIPSMRAILLYSRDWNPGVMGIVAAKLAEEYYRPVLLFHQQENVLTGSCRSIPHIHLFNCLQKFEGLFIRYGGHAQAAGITMLHSNFDTFASEFDTFLREHIPSQTFIPTMYYENEMPFSDLSIKDVEAFSMLAPFGEGNPLPVFLTKEVRLEDITRMGRDDSHLRAIAVQDNSRISLVAFGHGRRAGEWSQGGIFDMLYTPSINIWQQTKKLQLMLKAAKSVVFFDDLYYITQHRLKFYDAFFRNVLYNVTRSAVTQIVDDMDDAVARSISENDSGTLIVCTTPRGAQHLRQLLKERCLEDALDVFWNTVPPSAGSSNALLLAPYPDAILAKRFKRIFYFDTVAPWCLKFLSEMSYVSDRDYSDELLTPVRLTREGMGRIYQAFTAKLKTGAVHRAVLISETGAQSQETALLALLVFVELGFFCWDISADKVEMVANPTAKNLWDSSVYAAANQNEREEDTIA